MKISKLPRHSNPYFAGSGRWPRPALRIKLDPVLCGCRLHHPNRFRTYEWGR
jgi:hypothetical protein